MPIKFDPDHADSDVNGLRYVDGPSSQWEDDSLGARQLDEQHRSAIIEQMYQPMSAPRPVSGTTSTEAAHQLAHSQSVLSVLEATSAPGFDLTRGAHSGAETRRDTRSIDELEDALNTTGQLTARQWTRRAGLGR